MKLAGFFLLAVFAIEINAGFQKTYYTSFKDKKCELKLFGVHRFQGLNDIITDDIQVRKTYVDDKSLISSGMFFCI